MVSGAASWMPCGMSYSGFAGIQRTAIHIVYCTDVFVPSFDNKNVQQSDNQIVSIHYLKLFLFISRQD